MKWLPGFIFTCCLFALVARIQRGHALEVRKAYDSGYIAGKAMTLRMAQNQSNATFFGMGYSAGWQKALRKWRK